MEKYSTWIRLEIYPPELVTEPRDPHGTWRDALVPSRRNFENSIWSSRLVNDKQTSRPVPSGPVFRGSIIVAPSKVRSGLVLTGQGAPISNGIAYPVDRSMSPRGRMLQSLHEKAHGKTYPSLGLCLAHAWLMLLGIYCENKLGVVIDLSVTP